MEIILKKDSSELSAKALLLLAQVRSIKVYPYLVTNLANHGGCGFHDVYHYQRLSIEEAMAEAEKTNLRLSLQDLGDCVDDSGYKAPGEAFASYSIEEEENFRIDKNIIQIIKELGKNAGEFKILSIPDGSYYIIDEPEGDYDEYETCYYSASPIKVG